MGNGINKVFLLGNLTADPELLGDGDRKRLKLGVATNEFYKDKQGAHQERVDYHKVTMFGSRAEPLSRLLHKGSKVLIEGRVQTRKYEKDGQTKYFTEVLARDLYFTEPPRADLPTAVRASPVRASPVRASPVRAKHLAPVHTAVV